ncbi:MAG: glutamate--tRNA ligase [Akkermansiaceae bacterium]|nr:glutamate--tRNA ligase [Akkermansiaceae bacterium]
MDAAVSGAYTTRMTVRTRFAPSPTGYLHVGGARTALFNWLFARKHGGTFVLRVEDTDEARNTDEARQAIFDGMNWLGLDWDEGPQRGGNFGPYYQSERTAIYDAWFAKLVAADRVYEDGGAWRFRFERKPITMHDLVCGEVTIDYRDESNTPDMVVKRSDGSYVFHFVNVVDDLEMEISHVIRGEDHLMNTPKHLQLIEAFGGKAPQYAHIPLILNADASKMSKRDAGAAVGDYPRQGFLPSAVVNFVALLGWSSKTDEEIFTMDQLVDRFSLENVNRAPGRFDFEKCKWVSQQHLAALDDAAYHDAASAYLAHYQPEFHARPELIQLTRGKVRLFNEIPDYVRQWLPDAVIGYDDAELISKVTSNPLVIEHWPAMAEGLKSTPMDAVDFLKQYAESHSLNLGKLMLPLRYTISAQKSGPDLLPAISLLGAAAAGERMENFSKQFIQAAQA